MAFSTNDATPEGIFSLLDTDLYKLTMQCAILRFFPKISVAYRLTNRTPHMRLTRGAFKWLQTQTQRLGGIRLTTEELEWLRKTCPYLKDDYLDYLKQFRMDPKKHINLSFAPSSEAESVAEEDDVVGDVALGIKGLWIETILYEIPLLALISEAYFKFVDKDWNHEGQIHNAKQKGLRLLENGCIFSEFGSRRRRDYRTHDMVIQGLSEAQKESASNGKNWNGKFTGSSNVHFAMKYGVLPIGTVAHEWFMGIAAIDDDYSGANEKAMQYWTQTFGRGVLAIALTDTFGTRSFLEAFTKPAPKSNEASKADEQTFAQVFTGVRQDSGDPMEYLNIMKDFYHRQGITDKKVIVYSDSLNVDKCIQYKDATIAAGLTPSFGVGTFFTNDFMHESKAEKSLPLNIVIKLSEANARPAVKLSDNQGKNMGDDGLVKKVKQVVGYEEKTWQDGDEAHRWDQ